MFGFEDISLSFLTGQPWLVWPALVVLLVLSFLLYRRTNPPLPVGWRFLLGTIRVIAVLALVVALLEPVIGFSRRFERPRRVALLLDESLSMDRKEGDRTRRERLDSLLRSPGMDRLAQATDETRYYFAGNLSTNRTDVQREETALGKALQELDKAELDQRSDYWMLFSDGRNNAGILPATAAAAEGTPVVAIGLSGSGDGFDVAVDQVDCNPVMFVGRTSEIKVKLSWDGGENRNVKVRLIDSSRVAAEQSFVTQAATGLNEITLKYTPTTPGQRLLRVDIPGLEGETNDANNARTVAVKVMKSRLNVLVVADAPDYEVGFLNRFLNQSERYDVDLVITGPKAGNLRKRFPDRQAELNRYDLIVLYDPDVAKLTPYESLLRSYLSEKGGGVWLMMGPRFARHGSADWLNALLPFYPSQAADALVASLHGVPDEGQLFHPAVRLADDRAAIRERWASLPPFDLLVPCDKVDPDGVLLVTAGGPAVGNQRWPVLGFRRHGPGKLVASAALPFWTWDFETLGYEGSTVPYQRMLDGLIAWLTTQDDFDPVRVAPEKTVYHRGETVRFEGFAFDQGFRPLPGVSGQVTLTPTDAGTPFEADLLDRGEGKFTAEFNQLPPGTYHYEAGFEKGGQALEKNEGRVLVEPYSLEEYDQRGDPMTLAAVARASGGRYFDFRDFDSAVALIDQQPVVETVKGELSLWGRPWLLLIALAALGLEWVLRKVNYLI